MCPSRDSSLNRVKRRTRDSENICEKNVVVNAPLFVLPENGPLADFLDNCEKNGLTIVDGLHKLILNRKEVKIRELADG